jgi:hypothetical protein
VVCQFETRLTLDILAILSDDPQSSSIDLSRLDIAEGRDELFGDLGSKLGELFHHLSLDV